jgi:hypothetical protein
MIYRCSSMTQFVEINLHQNLSRLPINWSIPRQDGEMVGDHLASQYIKRRIAHLGGRATWR